MFLKASKSIFLTATLVFFSAFVVAQTITQPLSAFDKILVSPLINVVLEEGEAEHIRIEYTGIDPEKINYGVKGKKLRIYLDDAKYTVKTEEVVKDGYRQKVPIYRNVYITAYVTYRSLRSLQIRGEESISCKDSLVSEKFKIRQMGESHVELAYLQTRRLKAHLFGENKLEIEAGDSQVQKYRLFGENKVYTRKMAAEKISTSSFGESDLNLSATEKIKLLGIGEVEMRYSGDANLKRFVIGESSIHKW